MQKLLVQEKFKQLCKKIPRLSMKTPSLNHQKNEKIAKVPRQLADNPHREALINRNLLSIASLNS